MKTHKLTEPCQATAKTKKRTHEDISQLAYALYEQEGKPDGKALIHWFNAESMSESQFGYGKDHTEHDFGANKETLQ